MPRQFFFLSATVLILSLSLSVRSQETASLQGLDENVAVALRKRSIELLELVAGQIYSLRSAENRARIGSNVAELLWSHDEKRSRSLFAAVAEDIKAGFSETDSNEATQPHTLMVFGKLRTDTLGRIARHDPELALEFLRATRPPTEMQLPYPMRDGEKYLELRLASKIAAGNPHLALKLGQQSLEMGFSDHLVSLLLQLYPKDKDAFRSFYKEIVEKLKAANLARDAAATELALDLVRTFQPPEADETIHRDLIGTLLANALANGCAEASSHEALPICFAIGSAFSHIERYNAPRVAALKRWAGVARSFVPPPALVRETIENGTVDEILALAPRYPELQHQIYWSAVAKAEASGDVVRARQIASGLSNEDQRRYILTQIDRNQARKLVSVEKLAAIQQEIAGMRNNEQRIQTLFNLASQIGRNDRKEGLALLNQASVIVDSTKAGKTRLEGQFRLAMLYCSLKSDRGFTIIESVIPRLNEAVAAAAVLDGLENNYLRDGEWNMTGQGFLGGLLTALAQNAGCFAVQDFDRSLTLARQFERPELRLMAELRIAQGVLTNQTKPVPMFR